MNNRVSGVVVTEQFANVVAEVGSRAIYAAPGVAGELHDFSLLTRSWMGPEREAVREGSDKLVRAWRFVSQATTGVSGPQLTVCLDKVGVLVESCGRRFEITTVASIVWLDLSVVRRASSSLTVAVATQSAEVELDGSWLSHLVELLA